MEELLGKPSPYWHFRQATTLAFVHCQKYKDDGDDDYDYDDYLEDNGDDYHKDRP